MPDEMSKEQKAELAEFIMRRLEEGITLLRHIAGLPDEEIVQYLIEMSEDERKRLQFLTEFRSNQGEQFIGNPTDGAYRD